MLFDPTRHEPLSACKWSEELAIEVISDIFESTLNTFDENLFWKSHPDEDSQIECNKSLYYGAAGTVMALNKISAFLNKPMGFQPKDTMRKIIDAYERKPDTESIVPSYFLGSSGILLIAFRLTGEQEIATKLYTCVKQNISNPVNEALWGSPGSMLAALRMYEWTGGEKWLDLYKENADYLFKTWHQDELGTWLWTQDLYGNIDDLVGAGHGFFGNIFPLLQGLKNLSKKQQEIVLTRTADTLSRSAVIDDDIANWPVRFNSENAKFLVQWCHGSPGVLTSMGAFPVGYSEQVENLLLKGGELIWRSGPLKKGIAICHGTDGNGYAFLKLYKRTNDPIWLDRARKFAMHALDKKNGRHSLWTGDTGLACYLMSCIEMNADLPGLDIIYQ